MRMPFSAEGKTGFVFGARVQSGYRRVLELLREPGEKLIVCADGGAKIVRGLGLRCGLYVGDGDSGGSAPEGAESVILPREKDVTDMQAAVQLLLSRGYRKIVLCCATGGRLDHELANLLLLEFIAEKGAEGCLVDAQNEIRFAAPPFEATVETGEYRYLSLIPLDEYLTGVDMIDFQYPLSNHTVKRGDSLTISNEPCQGAIVRIKSGRALVILSSDRS